MMKYILSKPVTSFFILALFAVLFLSASLLEQDQSLDLLILCCLLVFVLLSFAQLFSKTSSISQYTFSQSILLVLGASVGGLATYVVSTYLAFGPVFGAAMIGTIAVVSRDLFVKFGATNAQEKVAASSPFFEDAFIEDLLLSIYCGAFAGMSSYNILLLNNDMANLVFISLIGAFAGLLFVFSRSVFVGVGGKLGMIAFISVTLVVKLVIGLFR